jgi:hypothetical protein
MMHRQRIGEEDGRNGNGGEKQISLSKNVEFEENKYHIHAFISIYKNHQMCEFEN